MRKRIFCIWLSVCMVLAMLPPISAMAEEDTLGTRGEIIAFAPLDNSEMSVSTGTAIEDLGLPETLSVTVRTAVTANSGTSEEPVPDSGNPEEDSTSGNSVDADTSSAIQENLNEQQEKEEENTTQWEVKTVEVPVTWVSEPEYDSNTEGVYVFTPVIEGYAVSADLPEITVTVGYPVFGEKLEVPVTEYDVWVGNVQVTSANSNGITGDGITGTVTYNHDTNTLTLDGATITSGYEIWWNKNSPAGIYAKGNLNLELKNINTITGINQSGAMHSYAVYNSANLTIIGNGTLNGTGGDTETGVSYGLYTTHDLSIQDNATVNMKSGNTIYGNCIGAMVFGVLTIQGSASLNATGGKVGGNNGISTGVNASKGIKVKDSASLAATSGISSNASYGIRYSKIEISGGTVTASTTDNGGAKLSGAMDKTPNLNSYTPAPVVMASNLGSGMNAIRTTLNDSNILSFKYIRIEPSSIPTAYAITANGATNGGYTVKVDGSAVTSAQSDDTVTITPTASSGYELDTISVYKTGEANKAVAVSNNTFTMPAYAVTIDITFKAAITSLDLTGVGYNVADGKITGTTSNMEYSLDGGSTWKPCTQGETTNLKFTAGTVNVRQKDNTTNERTVATIAVPATSTTPTMDSKTANSVTLHAIAGYEYSKDGGTTWQTSNVFSGLNSNTMYSFVARIKATSDTLPGTTSMTLTVTTNGTSSGGDGSSTSGGSTRRSSTGGGSTTPSSTQPTEPITGHTESKATVDDKGSTIASLTDKNITDAIADAKAEASKKGINAGDITAVIHVTSGGMNANTMTVNLPQTTQAQVISNKIASVQLIIDNPELTIGIDLAAVAEINRQAKADVQLLATRMDSSKLFGDAKSAIGNRPTYDLKANYGSDKFVTDFGKGSVRVEIPYALQIGEVAGNVCAVYVDENGKVTYLANSSYDTKRGTVVFSTSHFSTYGVAYNTSFKFTDIDDHWPMDDILFVANRDLMTGTSATTFNPNGTMTRGMFLAALGRLANVDTSTYKQSSFTDVETDAYYMGYIEWGVKNNILAGIGGGKFNPDGLVTREQMADIMNRYATSIGFRLPEVHAQNIFTDNDPQGTATRAEASAVLRRFVELTIFFKE